MNPKALEQMVIESKTRITAIEKSNKEKPTTPAIDVDRIERLTAKMEQTSVSNTTQSELLKQAIEEARKPTVKKNQHDININCPRTFYLIIALGITVLFLGAATFRAEHRNYQQEDNDLKYRYIKMKGSANPKLITDLEDLFEANRNNDAIDQIRENVEHFEDAVEKKALADEQARLNQLESKRLNEEAKSLKNK